MIVTCRANILIQEYALKKFKKKPVIIKCTLFNGQWSIVAGHVSINISWMNTIDDEIRTGILIKLALLDTGQSADPDFGNDVGAIGPSLAFVISIISCPE